MYFSKAKERIVEQLWTVISLSGTTGRWEAKRDNSRLDNPSVLLGTSFCVVILLSFMFILIMQQCSKVLAVPNKFSSTYQMVLCIY